MLTDNLEYLTDEERGWREELVQRSSVRDWARLLLPSIALVYERLLAALDRLAQARSKVISLGDIPQQQPAYITELEQQLSKLLFALDRAEGRANQSENAMLDINKELAKTMGERQRAYIAKLEEQLAHFKTRLENEKRISEKLAAEEKRNLQMSAELEVLRRRIAELEQGQKHAVRPIEQQPMPQRPTLQQQEIKPATKPEPQPEQPPEFADRGLHVDPRRVDTHF